MCGCAMAIRTGMGTSVCLHSDELVSERPLERAWQSPMTHSLLYLQDDTLGPGSGPCPLTAPYLQLRRGRCCCWLLSLSSPPPHSYCNSQETSVTQERVARLSITLLEMFYQVLVVNKHLLGSQPPQNSGLRSDSGIWAPSQGTPTDSPAIDMPPFLPQAIPLLSLCGHPLSTGQAPPLLGSHTVLISLVPAPSLSLLLSPLGGPLPTWPYCPLPRLTP